MIEWTRVTTLREEVGAENFEEVVDLFLEEVDEVVARLRACPPEEGLAADLHFLKGSAMSLGFESFSALCQNGETLASQGRAAEVDLPAILQNYAESKRQFQNSLPDALAG